MVSTHSDSAVRNILKNRSIKIENFILVNKMIDFISEIYNKIEVESQLFPLHVVLDRKGNCLAYMFGAFNNENSASRLVDFINELK